MSQYSTTPQPTQSPVSIEQRMRNREIIADELKTLVDVKSNNDSDAIYTGLERLIEKYTNKDTAIKTVKYINKDGKEQSVILPPNKNGVNMNGVADTIESDLDRNFTKTEFVLIPFIKSPHINSKIVELLFTQISKTKIFSDYDMLDAAVKTDDIEIMKMVIDKTIKNKKTALEWAPEPPTNAYDQLTKKIDELKKQLPTVTDYSEISKIQSQIKGYTDIKNMLVAQFNFPVSTKVKNRTERMANAVLTYMPSSKPADVPKVEPTTTNSFFGKLNPFRKSSGGKKSTKKQRGGKKLTKKQQGGKKQTKKLGKKSHKNKK